MMLGSSVDVYSSCLEEEDQGEDCSNPVEQAREPRQGDRGGGLGHKMLKLSLQDVMEELAVEVSRMKDSHGPPVLVFFRVLL